MTKIAGSLRKREESNRAQQQRAPYALPRAGDAGRSLADHYFLDNDKFYVYIIDID